MSNENELCKILDIHYDWIRRKSIMNKGGKLQIKDDQSSQNKYHKIIIYGACLWSLIYAIIFIVWPLRGSNIYIKEFGLDSVYQYGGSWFIVSYASLV